MSVELSYYPNGDHMMTLPELLADIDDSALDDMSKSLGDRSVKLLATDEPTAHSFGRLYGYLSAEMEVAAFSRRQLS